MSEPLVEMRDVYTDWAVPYAANHPVRRTTA